MIVQARAQLLKGEIGIEPLRHARESCAADAVVGEQIFESRGPVLRHRDLDPGPSCPAQPPQKGRFGRAAGQLRQRQLVVSPGETACRIKEPVSGSKTDAAPHGAGREDRLAIALCADRWRSKRRGAANGDSGEIWKGRERCIGLDPDDDAVREHVVIAGLKTRKEASRFGEGVDWLRQVDRAGDTGRCPIRASPSIAEMAARIEARPVIIQGDRILSRRNVGSFRAISRYDSDERKTSDQDPYYNGAAHRRGFCYCPGLWRHPCKSYDHGSLSVPSIHDSGMTEEDVGKARS